MNGKFGVGPFFKFFCMKFDEVLIEGYGSIFDILRKGK